MCRTILGKDAKVRFLRIDGGREYLTDEMKDVLKKEEVWVETTPPDTPQLNGTAERLNKTLIQRVRALLLDCGLPMEFWEYGLANATHLHISCPIRQSI